jgi:hypothetical protein
MMASKDTRAHDGGSNQNVAGVEKVGATPSELISCSDGRLSPGPLRFFVSYRSKYRPPVKSRPKTAIWAPKTAISEKDMLKN